MLGATHLHYLKVLCSFHKSRSCSIVSIYNYTNAVPCGVPSPPIHGTIHHFNGSEVAYRCDTEVDNMVATCQAGTWMPAAPSELTCGRISTESSGSD